MTDRGRLIALIGCILAVGVFLVFRLSSSGSHGVAATQEPKKIVAEGFSGPQEPPRPPQTIPIAQGAGAGSGFAHGHSGIAGPHTSQSAGGLIVVDGVEWQVVSGQCVTYNQAEKELPAGFELASGEDLLTFQNEAAVRLKFPALFRKDIKVWTSEVLPYSDKHKVLSFSSGKFEDQVEDLPACIVVRKT